MKTDDYAYKTEPFQHQIDAERFIADGRTDYFALFMEQGTGKTKTYIDFVENMNKHGYINRCMVIAPNGVHTQWGNKEIKIHGFQPSDTFIWHSDKKHRNMYERWIDQPTSVLRYFCVNVEAFSVTSYLDLFRDFVAGGKCAVVIDEATSIKNPDASRTNNIILGLSDVKKYGKRIMSVTPLAVSRAILTGTPEAKGAYGLWSMFEFLKHEYFGRNYYAFKARYGMERQVYFPGVLRPVKKPLQPEDFREVRAKAKEGMDAESIAVDMMMTVTDVNYILDNPDIMTPYKNLAELRELVDQRAFTVTKDQCLDLPDKIYEVRNVPMSEEQRKVYKQMKDTAYALYNNGALDAAQRVSIRMRLHQIAGGFFPTKYDLSEGFEQELKEIVVTPIGTPEKYKALVQMLEDQAKFPVIITTAFRAEALYLYENLTRKGYKCVKILGGMSKTDRETAVVDFAGGKAEILIATQMTIAKGYNLQFCSTMYLYSSTEASEDRMQLEDRIHRIGQTNHPVYVEFITENSVDLAIQKIVQGDVAFQNYMRSNDPSDFFKLIA